MVLFESIKSAKTVLTLRFRILVSFGSSEKVLNPYFREQFSATILFTTHDHNLWWLWSPIVRYFLQTFWRKLIHLLISIYHKLMVQKSYCSRAPLCVLDFSYPRHSRYFMPGASHASKVFPIYAKKKSSEGGGCTGLKSACIFRENIFRRYY